MLTRDLFTVANLLVRFVLPLPRRLCFHLCLSVCLFVCLLTSYYAPAPNRRGIKRCFCLTSDVCLSDVSCAAYIWRNSRTERPRKTKISTEIAHVTRDSDTTFKVKRSRSRSPGRFTQRANDFEVGNYCYVASARRRARRLGAHGGGEGRGHNLLKNYRPNLYEIVDFE